MNERPAYHYDYTRATPSRREGSTTCAAISWDRIGVVQHHPMGHADDHRRAVDTTRTPAPARHQSAPGGPPPEGTATTPMPSLSTERVRELAGRLDDDVADRGNCRSWRDRCRDGRDDESVLPEPAVAGTEISGAHEGQAMDMVRPGMRWICSTKVPMSYPTALEGPEVRQVFGSCGLTRSDHRGARRIPSGAPRREAG